MRQPSKLVSAWESDGDCIRLHLPTGDYLLDCDVARELIRQMIPLLPHKRDELSQIKKISAFIVSLFSALCGITLFMIALTNQGANHLISGFMLAGIVFQSLAFSILVWRNNQ